MMRRDLTSRAQRGQAMVEFALIAPLLMILLLFMIQYGLIMNTHVTIAHMAREGARYAAVHAATNAPIVAYIQAIRSPNIRTSDLTVAISPAEGTTARTVGNAITVALTYNMSRNMFMPARFLGVPLPGTSVRATASMYIE